MLKLYRQSLEEAGCFKDTFPKAFEATAKAIPGNIPYRMKVLMAATELIVYAGHLRKSIDWHGTSIPVNIISFLIGKSGSGKGMSIKNINNVLIDGYKKIDEHRETQARVVAIENAEADGKKAKEWRKYYSKPRSLKAGISTLQGMMKHLATLEAGKLGAGYLYVDEIGSELASNKDLAENIVALAVGYDTGEIAPKLLKDDTNQLDPIKNLPYSALLFGSPANIIYDEVVKKKFKEEFDTKLSRRSVFVFIKDKPKIPVFKSTAESREFFRKEFEEAEETITKLKPYFTSLVDSTTHVPLKVSREVEDLFSDYKGYNEWFAEEMSKQYPTSILHRQHLQWKSLKIAGALAILNGDNEINKGHFVEAVNFSEIYAKDMQEFEKELSKEPYEIFCDYMKTISQKGYASISVHKLKKMGFIKGAGAIQNKIIELVSLAKTYDDVNTYEVSNNYIHFYEGVEELTTERDELL